MVGRGRAGCGAPVTGKGTDLTMSHEETHAPASTESSGSAPFSPAECAALHEDDRTAAKGVFLLMVGVFTIGLLLYLYIALVV
jgi:hypothetical protein